MQIIYTGTHNYPVSVRKSSSRHVVKLNFQEKIKTTSDSH
jgi:hypothetical protein